MFKINCFAADFIPVRLIVSIAIISAISVLFAFGFFNSKIYISESKIEHGIDVVQSNIFSMIASGISRDIYELDSTNGTKRKVTLDIPENVIFLGFGFDPDEDNNGFYKAGLTEKGSVIYYKIEGSSKKVVWLDRNIKFREGIYRNNRWVINNPDQGFAIFSPGKITIVFELVERFNEQYVLIHCADELL